MGIVSCPYCGREFSDANLDLMVNEQNTKEAMAHWNRLAAKYGLRTIRTLDGQRWKKLQARLRQNPRWWQDIEAELPHLGQFAREKLFVDIDFLLQPSKLSQFLEGKYRDTNPVVAAETKRVEENKAKLESYKVDPKACSWDEFVKTKNWEPALGDKFVRQNLGRWKKGALPWQSIGSREPGEEG